MVAWSGSGDGRCCRRWQAGSARWWVVVATLLSCSVVAQPATGGTWVPSRRVPFGRPTSKSVLFEQRGWNFRGGATKTATKTGRKTTTATTKKTKKKKKSSSGGAKSATGNLKVGAAAAKEKEKTMFQVALQKYRSILPLSRLYITLVMVVTLLGLGLGEELAQSVLALDPIPTLYGLQWWRPLTAACYLGKPSIGWLMSAYYLLEYGSSLERAYGTAQHLVFLLSQGILLTLLSLVLAQPFFTSSVITAMLHVLSRSMPHQKVKWLVFTVPYWTLPYGLMASDILQTQSLMAGLPHVLGILSGHFYFFHKFVWPQLHAGAQDWLRAPDLLVRRMDPHVRLSTTTAAGETRGEKKTRPARKKGQGRKLGGT